MGSDSYFAGFFRLQGCGYKPSPCPRNWGAPIVTVPGHPGLDAVRRLPRGHARAHGDGVDLRRPRGPVQAAQQLPGRPAAAGGGGQGLGLGTRGQPDARTRLSAAWFRSDLHHDLQFVSSGGLAANAGYFQNIGLTRRQGLELSADRQAGPWALNLRYTWLDATYRSGFQANSPSHSQADADGAIEVRPGDRLPSLPRHSLSARLGLVTDGAVDTGGHTAAGQCTGGTRRRQRPGRARAVAWPRAAEPGPALDPRPPVQRFRRVPPVHWPAAVWPPVPTAPSVTRPAAHSGCGGARRAGGRPV